MRELAGEAEARRAVDAGETDAALVDAAEIVVRAEPPDQLVGLIRSRSGPFAARAHHGGAHARGGRRRAPASTAPRRRARARGLRSRETATVVFVGVLLLYGQLFAYGYWVAAGVVEEKSSRVVEVLLATVRPSHLLRGKILGIGLLGLGQLLLIGLVGLFASAAVGTLEFPPARSRRSGS